VPDQIPREHDDDDDDDDDEDDEDDDDDVDDTDCLTLRLLSVDSVRSNFVQSLTVIKPVYYMCSRSKVKG